MLEGLQKRLQANIAGKIYDKFASGILQSAENIELQLDENFPAIMLYPDEARQEIWYSVITLKKQDDPFTKMPIISRILRTDKLKTMFENSNINMADFDLTSMLNPGE